MCLNVCNLYLDSKPVDQCVVMLVLGIDVGIINPASCLAIVEDGQAAQVVDCINFRIANPKDSINDLIKRLVHAIQEHSSIMEPDGL
jgi:hypothetical protein